MAPAILEQHNMDELISNIEFRHVVSGVLLLLITALVVWLLRFLTRYAKTAENVMHGAPKGMLAETAKMSEETIKAQEESMRILRESIQLQRESVSLHKENNELLREIRDALRK